MRRRRKRHFSTTATGRQNCRHRRRRRRSDAKFGRTIKKPTPRPTRSRRNFCRRHRRQRRQRFWSVDKTCRRRRTTMEAATTTRTKFSEKTRSYEKAKPKTVIPFLYDSFKSTLFVKFCAMSVERLLENKR